ncbi:hypothetical protein GYMLUDRAFT_47084 [Collybiopsis luxurians FD-317 M1]|uniref:Unplaced genomic scaffold GYMLUscaffold_50, whole genome shotgun sequence n=1 Tax=Collybiopsis luxurians FD-317 M1 TaxID=944289 RepID=A0A0D0CE28_9AGAR|nr:hypothetical protein GYMLUDRAFT_47084 [Collybiopsis luxurians FD-317 M1]
MQSPNSSASTAKTSSENVDQVQESFEGISISDSPNKPVSPNPWSDSGGLPISKSHAAEVEVEKLRKEGDEEPEFHHTLHTPDPSTFDQSVAEGFAADPQASAPPLVSPPATEVLQEFDPLADQEAEYAKKAWEESEGHPPPVPPHDGTSSPPPPVPPLKDLPSPSQSPPTSIGSGFPSSLAALARSFSIPSLARSPNSKSRPLSMETAKPVPSPNTLSTFASQQGPSHPQSKSTEDGERREEGDYSGESDSGSESSKRDQSDPPFDFQNFLDQMKMRSAEPVSKYLKSFLSNFSKRTFTINDQIKIINDFLNFISSQMRQCEPWKNASDAEFDNAMEGMEKLVMNQLYQYTFTPAIAQDINPATGLPRRVISVDDLERDRILSQRIALFGWIQEEHLDIPTEEGSAGFLMFAEQELLKLNHYKAPRDKLICILNCCKVIFGLIRHLQKDEGADAFVPILIFVVLKANPENLLSNVEFINRFRNPDKLQSEAGYYLSSLMGAVQFIESMDHTSLSNISQEEFAANVDAAIKELPTNPDGTPQLLTTSSSSSSSSSSSISSISTPVRNSPHVGAESAQPLSLPLARTSSPAPMAQQLSEDARRLLQKTGDAVSKPLSAISRIFNEALDLAEENFSSPERYHSTGTSRAGTPAGGGPPTIPPWSHPMAQGTASQSLPDSRSSSPASFMGYQTPAPSGDLAPPIQTPYKPRVRRIPSPGGYLAQAQAPVSGQGLFSPGYSPDETPTRPMRSGFVPQTHTPLAIGPSQPINPPPRGQSLRFRPPGNGPYYDQPSSPLGSPVPYSRASTPGGDLDIAGMQAEIDHAHSQATEAAKSTLTQIFPGVDTEVIEWVLEANEGDLGKSIEQLLEMSGGA